MRWSKRFASVLLVSLCVACAEQDEIQKPMAPDMSEVVAAYDAPTAPLTAEDIETVATTVNERIALLREVGADGQIIEAVRAAAEAEKEGDPGGTLQSTTEPVRSVRQRELVFGNGYLRAVRICNGWGPEPVPNLDENGFLLLIAGFTDVGFDAVAWGGFFNCKYMVQGVRVELRGSTPEEYGQYRVFIGEDVPFDQTALGPTFFRFDLVSIVNDQEAPLNFDVRIDYSTQIVETRVTVNNDGYVIPAAGTELLGIRATNGDFVCTIASRSCTNGSETLEF